MLCRSIASPKSMDSPNSSRSTPKDLKKACSKGATKILQRRPKIAVEVHVEWVARYGSSVRAVLDLLSLDSYRVWVLLHGSADVTRWNGEDLTSAPPPKFHLFMLPA